eukprot:CAMPEP_0172495538 /NCGR_PEP_ID=MMETSP1066-20121228/71454_1 /TAXON_ID=671091 /ORGANISM="Coscinodiscus wailesii, Strain CCMP2513" /LENGTH=814 /DNA_ID=CAMNT_0013267279 /DNA_START=168 /DNA_END=2612 /DNA_ORIENTATION=-
MKLTRITLLCALFAIVIPLSADDDILTASAARRVNATPSHSGESGSGGAFEAFEESAGTDEGHGTGKEEDGHSDCSCSNPDLAEGSEIDDEDVDDEEEAEDEEEESGEMSEEEDVDGEEQDEEEKDEEEEEDVTTGGNVVEENVNGDNLSHSETDSEIEKDETSEPEETTATVKDTQQDEQREKKRNEEATDDGKNDTNNTPPPTIETVTSEEESRRDDDPTPPQTNSSSDPPLPVDNDDDDDDSQPHHRVIINYAHKSSGALILEHSPSYQGTSHLLTSDKDKYAIAPCGDKKFVVIGLSEDILVKQVVISNYERYSSEFRLVQVLGSNTFPMGNWVDFGVYEGDGTKGEQVFDLREKSWARYLKFKFLEHYGEEHYCTVSQIKVHGSTVQQGMQEQWEEETKEKVEEEEVVTEETDVVREVEETDEEETEESEEELSGDDEDEGEEKEESEEEEKEDDTEASSSSVTTDAKSINEEATEQTQQQPSAPSSDQTDNSRSFDNNTPIPDDVVSSTETVTHLDDFEFNIDDEVEIINPDTAYDPEMIQSINNNNSIHENYTTKVQDAIKSVAESEIVKEGVKQLTKIINKITNDEEELAAESEDVKVNNDEVDNDIENDDTDIDNDTPTPQDDEKDVPSKQSDHKETQPQQIIDYQIPHALLTRLPHLPSLTCLSSLTTPPTLQHSSKKASQPTHPSGNKPEPIFKTLMDEIKILQTNLQNQSIYSSQMAQCYNSILAELLQEMEKRDNSREIRLVLLEESLKELKRQKWYQCNGSEWYAVGVILACLLWRRKREGDYIETVTTPKIKGKKNKRV